MRRLTEPEAHRARAAIIEGDYPEGMTARCAWCRKIAAVSAGRFVSVHVPGTGATSVFKCPDCLGGEREGAA
ncbi:MAG: hypothetical protein M3526_00585 [Actinomycetota bacterium]|jgi:hypothetical protein|nr:hypothetical protein [Actinomycetota bacterium]MDQ5873861.1 hypothetical protein [Actinomycetota bacterium]